MTAAQRRAGLLVVRVGEIVVQRQTGVPRHVLRQRADDAIALTEVGKPCYVVDDQTVAKTNNAGARPVAGTVFDVDAQGVWVEFS